MQIVIYYNKFRNIKEREKMLFSEEAIGFLFENHARDSKEWFKEHKADYHRLIEEPFAELITALTPIMNDIDMDYIPFCFSVSTKTFKTLYVQLLFFVFILTHCTFKLLSFLMFRNKQL